MENNRKLNHLNGYLLKIRITFKLTYIKSVMQFEMFLELAGFPIHHRTFGALVVVLFTGVAFLLPPSLRLACLGLT